MHGGPEGTPRWRDTDMEITGPAVADAGNQFTRVWNDQITRRGLSRTRLPMVPVPVASGAARVAVTEHVPGRDAHILLATLKVIEGARRTLDIENAYFITTPDLRAAVLRALDRDVRVRILTNSAESVDEPIVSAPILASLPELVARGAEVYLKRGDTLHSKFLLADGIYAWVGSYNLHPRSQRYETEMVLQVLSAPFATALGTAFEADVLAARHVTTGDSIAVPRSTFTFIAAKYFFDQL